MLAYQVSKSIEINKSQSEIIDYLKDFKTGLSGLLGSFWSQAAS